MADRGLFERMVTGILGDTARPDTERPKLGVPMLADWLPYRSHDPKTGIFYNSASRGFVVEASPLIGANERSEEHTSELQSLMRISYAVFCLKKKKYQPYIS